MIDTFQMQKGEIKKKKKNPSFIFYFLIRSLFAKHISKSLFHLLHVNSNGWWKAVSVRMAQQNPARNNFKRLPFDISVRLLSFRFHRDNTYPTSKITSTIHVQEIINKTGWFIVLKDQNTYQVSEEWVETQKWGGKCETG